MAYQKGGSSKEASGVNRDRGWDTVEESGYRRVSQVAIDEKWSALRFRNARHVGSSKRSRS
jgi:uncharacterized protein YbdZ (MbtH family)